MSVELLSRLQFAGTVMFHYLFPPLTIGLGLIMVLLEFQWLRTRDMAWNRAARFWTRIFALNFALGVATGIVMEFEFGTNWAAYSRFVGDVFGSALAAEGIFAFFLESGFLAVLVFGWNRVGPKMHFFSSLMVFFGSMFSAVWIVVANSWQQTPAGYHIVAQNLNGKIVHRAEITDFWAMVFNPSSMDRLAHTLIGAMILGAFFVLSISAFYVLRNKHAELTRRCIPLALVVGAIFSLLALVSGHSNAEMVAEHQPAKLAAFEGHFQTGPGDLHLFGWPDADRKEVRGGIGIPGMLSWLIHGDTKAEVTGLDAFPKADQPPVWLSFQAYHLMVALGMFFIVLTIGSLPLLRGGRIYRMRWLMWVFVFAVIGPFIANQSGWVAAEVGRQPWTVYPAMQDGVQMAGLRTSESLSESVTSGQVLWSIIMFGLIYVLLFAVWVYVLNEKIKHGPETPETPERKGKPQDEGFLAVGVERLESGGDHLLEPGAGA